MIDIFTAVLPVPRELFETDKQTMYDVLTREYWIMMYNSNRVRIPGPIMMETRYFGYIDDDSMEEVIVGLSYSSLWTYVVIRVSGPAEKS